MGRPLMGSLRCARCENQWPYRDRYRSCPFCGIPTGWSSAHANTTAANEKRADEMIAGVNELAADLRELERYAAGSSRLLSFPVALNRWPTASDVAALGPWVEPKAKPGQQKAV